MNSLFVNLPLGSYEIIIESGCLKNAGNLISRLQIGKNLVLISDKNVSDLYGQEVLEDLRNNNFRVLSLDIPVGEFSKNLDTIDLLFEKMIKANVDRHATVLALGGGVVGDVAGFVAATYMRGISFVQIPTTLLAQTDSSVGGKVGINHRLGKNMIGAFYQPKMVITDPLVLSTLDARELYSGFGEVLKYGLIRDSSFFNSLCQNHSKILEKLDVNTLEETIKRCCEIKTDIVQKDEKEFGLRRILNFGHTIGHALEALTNYKYYSHGEAVILGMKAMCYLSNQEKLLTNEELQKVDDLINKLKIKKPPKTVSTQKIIKKIYFDKKNRNKELCVVLLNGIGDAVIAEKYDEKKIKNAVDYLMESWREIDDDE